jgi:hypothetical protein
MVSAVALIVDVPGGSWSDELTSFSVELSTGEVADRFGLIVVDGVDAKDLRTWAANSARVAGMGRPGPLPRCSRVEAVVGGAGSTGGWAWGVGVARGCGALLGLGAGFCVEADF